MKTRFLLIGLLALISVACAEPDFPGFIPVKLNPAFHMVWDWGGKANGYYTYFITQQRLQEISSENLEEGYPDQFWNLRLFGRYTVFRKID